MTNVGLGSFFSFCSRIALPFACCALVYVLTIGFDQMSRTSATFLSRRSTLWALASFLKPSMMQLAV